MNGKLSIATYGTSLINRSRNETQNLFILTATIDKIKLLVRLLRREKSILSYKT